VEIIVGSKALEYFSMNRLPPSDTDIWTDDPSYSEAGVDAMIIPEHILRIVPTKDSYATPDAIYTIKCSHFGWNIHWQKTKLDVLWLKARGCNLIPNLYRHLVNHWKQVNGNKEFLSLNKSKQEFFQDNVTYVYGHDYLHELVAYPNRPVYESVLKDNAEVSIDNAKFDILSFEQKVRMFREEISVIAAERWLINPYWCGKVSWYKAYQLSLEKTVTSLIKNRAQEFVTLNIEHFIKPDYSYFSHLLSVIKEGEYIMSNVNLSVFQELVDKVGADSLEHMIYEMCGNDFGVRPSIRYPGRGHRNGSDSSYQEEVAAYRVEYSRLKALKEKELGIEYEHLDQDGGGEGGSEYCYGVFKLNGKIYRAEYSYYSHHGHDYDSIVETLREVKPVEKTVTVYE
jgi:hypothetical protein